MAVEVKIPEVGESIREVQIAQWLKQEGEWVEKDEEVVELDTDKATLQVSAPASGRLAKILKKAGDMAEVGDTIAQLEEGQKEGQEKKARREDQQQDEGPEDADRQKKSAEAEPRSRQKTRSDDEEGKTSKKAAKQSQEPVKKESAKQPTTRQSQERVADKDAAQQERHVMPAARRALSEHGLSADKVEATGPGGRLLKEDVLRHVQEQQDGKGAKKKQGDETEQAATPSETTAPARDQEIVPMTMIRRRIAQRLVEAQQKAALLTTFNEIDMQAVVDLRQRHRDEFQQEYGIKLGFMSFFVKGAVEALKRFPAVNAEVQGTDIVYRNYYDIGIAVGGGKGLVVPVLRNAERMSFADIERTIDELARRARDNKLKPDELEGGTFTISNGGIYGSLLSTPIVNPPQSGVLGLHAIQDRPVAREGQVVIRPMMYVALTYDHRLVDGREAVSFLKHIKEVIEEPSRMLIEV